MKRNLIVALSMLLLLAACAGGADNSEAPEAPGQSIDGGGETGFVPDEEALYRDGDLTGNVVLDVVLTDSRKVIRRVNVSLAADKTRATYDEIIKIAEAAGGFVANAEVRPSDENQEPYISVTIRIPSSELNNSLAAIKKAADEVISESQGAEDVTAAFIDLEAQLANLTALETELRALLEEVRKQPDADPEKLLRVFTEISNTRGQIEQIQGQLNYLNDVVDLSTVDVQIAPTAAAVPIVETSWAPLETVRDALRSLVSGLQDLADLAINFIIGILPLLILILGIPGLVLFFLYRAWRKRQKPPVITPPVPATE